MASALRAGSDDLGNGHSLRHRGLGDAVVAIDQGIAQAKFDRIDLEFTRQLVHR